MIKNCNTMESYYNTIEEARIFFELLGFVTTLITEHTYQATSEKEDILVGTSDGYVKTYLIYIDHNICVKNKH